jgi:hypothetical protein
MTTRASSRRGVSEIALRRLHNQSLIVPAFDNPPDVVAWLGAVQCQDFAAGKWALGMRLTHATDAAVEDAFNRGAMVRTHVMRPTWHFVPPGDVRWMQKLTSARVRARLAPYDRKLELTSTLLARCRTILTHALRDHDLTRDELAEHLKRKGVDARGPRLAHIVMDSELEGLVCSGPRRGKQFTYALLDRRVPKSKRLPREEARALLAFRYFESHGPAQLKDFAWWSGLAAKDAAQGLDSVKAKLVEETLDGKVYWSSPDRGAVRTSARAHFLSVYDEYVIAYKDRSALQGERYIAKFLAMGSALNAVLVFDGRLIGTWKPTAGKQSVELAVQPLRRLTRVEQDAVQTAASGYGEFLGLPVKLRQAAVKDSP